MDRSESIEVLKRKAAEDMMVAGYILDRDDELTAQIGFHLQQFVEKTMKASLREHRIKYPKTHDLAVLLKLFPQKNISEGDKAFAYTLSQFAVESRYEDAYTSPWGGQQMLDRTKTFAERIETFWDDA